LWYLILIVWPFVAADGTTTVRYGTSWQWQDFLAGLIASLVLFGLGELVLCIYKRRRS
jgi:hypothetical protein